MVEDVKSKPPQKGAVQIALRRELKRRQKINPRYSQRAFARFLRINDSFLTKLIKGNRFPSESLLVELSKRLEWEESLLEKMVKWMKSQKAKRKKTPN